MIRKINGVNFIGSPGGTMSQSISSGTSSSNSAYTILGSTYFDKQFLNDDVLNVRASFTQTTGNGDTFGIKLYWGTQSNVTTGIQLGYYESVVVSNPVLARSLWFVSTNCSVISSTTSVANDYGDTSTPIQNITIPNSNGYFFIACSNTTASRLADTISLNYFVIEPIKYGRPSVIGSTNQGIFHRNGTYSYAFDSTGFLNDGFISITGTTSNQIAAQVEMTGRVSDGDLIRVETRINRATTVSSYTQRFYFNTTPSLTGATLISTRGVSLTNVFQHITRRMYIESANGTGNGTQVLGSFNGYNSEYSTAAGAFTNTFLAVDWTSTCYLICAIQLNSSSDVINCDYISVHSYS